MTKQPNRPTTTGSPVAFVVVEISNLGDQTWKQWEARFGALPKGPVFVERGTGFLWLQFAAPYGVEVREKVLGAGMRLTSRIPNGIFLGWLDLDRPLPMLPTALRVDWASLDIEA